LSASSLPGRVRRRPAGVSTAGTSSRTAASMITSEMLATVTTAVSGSPLPRRRGGSWTPACRDRLDLRRRDPPRLARTLAESTLVRDQSNRPARPSRSSTSRWSCSNTPALAHSFNRRHAVAGEPQPSFLDWQEPPRGRGAGHVDDRGETAAIWNRSPSAAIPGVRCRVGQATTGRRLREGHDSRVAGSRRPGTSIASSRDPGRLLQ
jgi:hypothetical protein